MDDKRFTVTYKGTEYQAKNINEGQISALELASGTGDKRLMVKIIATLIEDCFGPEVWSDFVVQIAKGTATVHDITGLLRATVEVQKAAAETKPADEAEPVLADGA